MLDTPPAAWKLNSESCVPIHPRERLEGKNQQLWTEKNDALRVNLRQVNLQMVSKLFRNVPIVNYLEMSPFVFGVLVGMRTEAKPCS
jgi:hypothetical protein